MIVDLFLVYQLVKRLATPFEEWPAFKEGIIDKDGNILIPKKNRNTIRQQQALSLYDVMVLKLKKLLAKVPGGQSRLASYAAALWLIREGKDYESTAEDLTEQQLSESLERYLDYTTEAFDVNRKFEQMMEDGAAGGLGGGAPANSAGAGQIAGIGIGKDGEPGVSKAAQKRITKNNRSMFRRWTSN